ncbi:MAG: cytochrome c biogenesis protein CcdA [Pyrobaculum sp.]
MKVILLTLFVLYLSALQIGPLSFTEVTSQIDLHNALREGPVLVFIHSPTCPACQYMISQVFTKDEVAAALSGVNLLSIDLSKYRITSLEVFIDGQVYIYYGGLRTERGSGRINLPIVGTPTVVMGYVKNGSIHPVVVLVGAVDPNKFLELLRLAYSLQSVESAHIDTSLSFVLQLLISFAAGVVSVFSPCVLPVVTIAATTLLAKRSLVLVLIGMVASYAVLATVLSTAAAAASGALAVLYGLGGALLTVMGAFLLSERLNRTFVSSVSKLQTAAHKFSKRHSGALGDLALGASLGAVWTPCVAPIFGAVAVANIVISTLRGDLLAVFLTTLAYAAGLAVVVYIVITAARKKMHKFGVGKWGALGRRIEYIVGVLSIVLGVLLIGEALGLGTFSKIFAV